MEVPTNTEVLRFGFNLAVSYGDCELSYEAGSIARATKYLTFGALADPFGTAQYTNYSYSAYTIYEV